MNRFILASLLVWSALAASGHAQDSGASVASAAGQTVSAPAVGLQRIDAARAAPEDMESGDVLGIVAALNELRARVDAPDLVWSGDLARKASAAIDAATEKSCSRSAAARFAESQDASVYWAAPLRRADGSAIAQEIAPHFVAREWRVEGADYDAATGACKRYSGGCMSFVRVTAPEARTVGCARAICPSQAQIWACKVGE